MGKSISIDVFSKRSIQAAIKELEKYRDSLPDKCKEVVERLAKLGLTVAESHVAESPLHKYINVRVESESILNGFEAVLIATGEIKHSENYPPFSTILSVEFGAGIHFNPTPNPKAELLGYGVGTFPNQIHAESPSGWWFWNEEKQVWMHSYGVKATMPMYNADIQILAQVEKVVKEVFGG